MAKRHLRLSVPGLLLASVALAGCSSGSTPPLNSTPDAPASKGPIRPAGNAFNWAQPFLNAEHTGYNTAEIKLKRSNVSKLKSAWSFSAGGIQDGAMVTDGNLAYVQGVPGSGNGYLYAVNIKTGTQKWKFETYGGFEYTPAVSGTLVYDDCLVGGSNQQAGLCAIDKTTGKLKWSFYSDCNCLPPAGPTQGPAISGSTIVFGYTLGGGGSPNHIIALDAATGSVLWNVAGGSGGPNGLADGIPAIDGSNVFMGTDHGVCSYQLSSGSLNWCDDNGGHGTLSVTATNGVVYASYTTFSSSGGDVVYAENESDGSLIWSYNACDGCAAGYNDSPAIANGIVYASANNGGYLYALNASTGALEWSTSGGSALTNSAPSIANGVVYVSCGNTANICAYNSSTGALLASVGTNGTGYRGSPAIADGKVYGICGYNYLCMFDL